MKTIIMFIYSIISYLIAFASLLFWILSASQFIPEISIDRSPEVSLPMALLNNIGLVLLFGLQHSVTARKPFKEWITKVLPKPIERSTYVLMSGILLALLVWKWEPMGGVIWTIGKESIFYYAIVALYFIGFSILLISSFLINHFDLFGLRQTYYELIKKPYTPPVFKIRSFYKYIRHPLYFGIMLGVWSTPIMTVSHLCFAVLLSGYIIIGALLEEKDLIRDFGDSYREYQKKTGMFFPH